MEDVLLNQGVLGVLVLFFLTFLYKYFNLKLDNMRREFEHRLKDKLYRVKGNVKIEGDNEYQIDVEIDFKEDAENSE